MTKFENSLGSRWLPKLFSNLVIHHYQPMEMEQTQCSETSAYKFENKFENSLGSRLLPKLFSNLVIHHLPAYGDGTDRVFRNVGI